ncbi:MAG: ZPR1 zinc finger domain-containing protein [Promethearchaeota archaeon]
MKEYEKRFLFTNQECPCCKKKMLSQSYLIYNEPKSNEKLLLFTTSCEYCNFKETNMFPLKPSNFAWGNKYILSIEDLEDVESKIYRAPSGSILIPELGLELEPLSNPIPFITNVEGLLIKFKEICEFLARNESSSEKIQNLQLKIKEIEESIKGKRKFKIILSDPEGFSYIIPKRKTRLTIQE